MGDSPEGQSPHQIPSPVTHVWAGRKFHWSNVDVNKTGSNYTVVVPGQPVEVSLQFKTEWEYNSSDYCPGCIVQLYYGLGDGQLQRDGGFSTGIVESGIHSNSGSSSTEFTAPREPGVYYITWAISLDYHYVVKKHSNKFEAALGAIHVLHKRDWNSKVLWPLVPALPRQAVMAFIISSTGGDWSMQVGCPHSSAEL